MEGRESKEREGGGGRLNDEIAQSNDPIQRLRTAIQRERLNLAAQSNGSMQRHGSVQCLNSAAQPTSKVIDADEVNTKTFKP